MLTNDKKILIIGMGLLGGSYAEGLTDAGYYVGGLDVDKEAIRYAYDKGIITSGDTVVRKQFVEMFDIVVFAVYPKVMIEWLKKYQSFIKPGALITDVTGVKGWLINELNSFLRTDVEFVGAHPMAGREVGGVKNSTKEMFKEANFIITPTIKTTLTGMSTVRDIAEVLEFKNITTLSVEEHDEMIGFLSQLTHCIAVTLMTCKESSDLVEYTGDSFRDLTRIAKINENMWSELFLLNKEELLNQMNLFLKQFNELKETIENDDVEKMKDIMRLSTIRRSYFDR
ncbi:MAG: prephenate dehydrogenase [Bacilli bacterium]|nr:prephenate dehydrogenase [Bacilli bacterium]